jgi:hypothetical protein
MFTACLFCDAPLVRNDALEHFPVGRRLAFDPERSRVWVVCDRCERWNLASPEESGPAAEDCERRFRATRLRRSTPNVGLARLVEGVDLVRIGRPLRPELALWRYGDQFGRRRRRHALLAAGAGAVAVVAATAGLLTGGLALVLPAATLLPAARRLDLEVVLRHTVRRHDVVAHVPGTSTPVRARHLDEVRILMGGPWEDGWGLAVSDGTGYHVFAGDEALRMAGRLLARLNAAGATETDVDVAVTLLERHGSAASFFKWASRRPERERHRLAGMPVEVRLALEMLAHEETERRLMDGELERLEGQWAREVEIAGIVEGLQ